MKTRQIGAAWFALCGARTGCASRCMLLACRGGRGALMNNKLPFSPHCNPVISKSILLAFLPALESSKSCSTGGKLRHEATSLFSTMPGWSHALQSRVFPSCLSGLSLLSPLLSVFWEWKPWGPACPHLPHVQAPALGAKASPPALPLSCFPSSCFFCHVSPFLAVK